MRLPLLLAIAASISACDRPAPEREQSISPDSKEAAAEGEGVLDRSLAGAAAPNTSFEDPDGEAVTLAEFRGKPLLVNLWATWCAPCIKEMPTLDALAAREGEKLTVLTISQDRDGRQKVEAFFDRHGFKAIDSYLDPQMALLSDMQIHTLPTTILYDGRGREVWRMVGIIDWTGPDAARLIAEAG